MRAVSEQVLRGIEKGYGPLPEGVPSVAYIFEPGLEGSCLYISPSVEDVLGYPRDQWLDERGLWDRILHPDDYERVTSNEAECARSGEKLVQEYRLRSADGRDVWIRDEMTVCAACTATPRRSSTASSSTSPTASAWRASSSGWPCSIRSPTCPTARCSATAYARCSPTATGPWPPPSTSST